MMAPAPDAQQVAEALARHGITPRAMELVSPLRESKGRRWAYRVEAGDGRIVKARQFESENEASRVCELRQGLEEAFAPVLARYGAVLIEEWIDGSPLAEHDEEERIEEAGEILGRLHARPLAPDAPASVNTARWREGADANLELLAAAGKLTARQVAALRAQVALRDPSSAPAAFIHLDFARDNMVIDRNGRLRIIDNEMVTLGPVGFDLARTFNLWPMPDAARALFRRGYDSTAPCRPEAVGFWRIVAALIGARIFLERNPNRLAVALAQLERFLAGECLADE